MKIKIDKTLAVKGLGRWALAFGNKIVECTWDPDKGHWTFPDSHNTLITEDPDFFVQEYLGLLSRTKR